LDRQNAATPELPAAHRLPPDAANVTEFRDRDVVSWLTGILVHWGEESRDIPCRTVVPLASASPTAQASDELNITMERRFGVEDPQIPGLTEPVQVVPSIV
jgi:hypothetical protein